MAITISLCMIVKNEEVHLARCLDSVAEIPDEIIIIDTGSTDKTVEIAKRYTDKVYPFVWQDDFSLARNQSFSKATMDYCMWLDADDVIPPWAQVQLLALKQTLSRDVDMVMLPYYTTLKPDGSPAFWYYRERIIRNCQAFRWVEPIHEVIVPQGTILYADAPILHQKEGAGSPDRNLHILEKAALHGLSPRLQFYYGRELFDHNRINEAISVFRSFLDHPDGWIENKINACAILSDCYVKQGDSIRAFHALLHSFTLDQPRAEICCALGQQFMDREDYTSAAYWYETALACPYQPRGGGFIIEDCYGYLPSIQLCVCYDRLGDPIRAASYNEKAGRFRPDSSAYLANKKYFSKLYPKSKESE